MVGHKELKDHVLEESWSEYMWVNSKNFIWLSREDILFRCQSICFFFGLKAYPQLLAAEILAHSSSPDTLDATNWSFVFINKQN